ncbi:MAG: DUF1616 domain-containing protein [Chloroflexota bacterium]|nr:DUF1616 domain-containing protein [Chloroflexota bacterium]
MDLLVILCLSIVLDIILGLDTSGPVRIGIGLPFLLLFPGYTLIAALFPKRDDLEGVERVVLSFGLSIAIVPLIGLILNYTPWGINLAPILVSITIFIIVMAAIAWYRRFNIDEQHRFSISISLSSLGWKDMGGLDKVLSVVLMISIIGAIGTLAYVIATPRVGEKFSEFYVLGLEGRAEGYPKSLRPGQEGRVILGITNREHEDTDYEVSLRIGNQGTSIWMNQQEFEYLEIPSLKHGEEWQQEISFIPQETSNQPQKVEFILRNMTKQAKDDNHVLSEIMDTTIDLWFEEKGKIRIINRGEEEASYQINLVAAEGPIQILPAEDDDRILAPGDAWVEDFSFSSLETTYITVYRDDQLIFNHNGAYGSLHIWINVT